MDVVTTSLEALIQRATNPQNEKPDIAAIEAFCVMLGKDSKGVHVASRLLATHIQSTNEKEASQALTLLDTCMKRCGRSFHAEIGKFRFLNIMIKLVSPKYLGNTTASVVRQKILELLYAWTRDYPREVKIKETYEMLKKQGVVKEQVSPVTNIPTDSSKPAKIKNPIFEDEEKTKLLQDLLRSKDPFNLKLANKLIKSMVKDDEKRVQLNSQRNMELESVHNNVKLLSEMLDSYDPGKSSAEDVELMKELYDACERLKPTVSRLANETQDNDEMLGDVLAANDQLTQVFEKYATVIVLGRASRGGNLVNNATSSSAATSLLDLSSPSDIGAILPSPSNFNNKSSELFSNRAKSDMEMLGDIFSSLGNSIEPSTSSLALSDGNIMQPISILPTRGKELPNSTLLLDSKAKALEDLNQLGESLLKESLGKSINVTRNSVKNISRTMNDIEISGKSSDNLIDARVPKNPQIFVGVEPIKDGKAAANGLGLDMNLGPVDNSPSLTEKNRQVADFVDLLNDDDVMLDVSSLPSQIADHNFNDNNDKNNLTSSASIASKGSSLSITNSEIKPLTDIHVTLDSIKPGTIPPLTVIEEKNGISVVLHFAKGSPREDVTVIVVTTMSKNSKALTNYLFQAVVSENCKCRLEAPSGTRLPGHNPFLPPSAITQIMLIANPKKDKSSLKFMLSYTMEDETFTEMGEVDELPAA